MKFSLIFENSKDSIDFDTVYNADLLQYFVSTAQEKNSNSFGDDGKVARTVDGLLNDIHNSLSLTNSVMFDLASIKFTEQDNRFGYLDQTVLNKQHEHWVFSQEKIIDIDQLRFSTNAVASKLGWKLHDLYPDDIRHVKLAEAMQKLGYIFPYEEVNMTLHRLESFYARNIEYKADNKWQVFDNPYKDTMISNNDVVNFSFGYTYVGRQYYNKWQFYDTNLNCKDHYNYETLEFAFQVNLDRPQTIPYSKEFLSWCDEQGVPPISTQIPIANAVDIEHNLKYYRSILYKNSRAGNKASISIK